ncbi:hypothetical protein HanRHA438_Chr09g0398521 [Helianthus annuus]|nr:hypothetical protein HanRHA438_Chr09g0398521 [Helianthus annuus]
MLLDKMYFLAIYIPSYYFKPLSNSIPNSKTHTPSFSPCRITSAFPNSQDSSLTFLKAFAKRVYMTPFFLL